MPARKMMPRYASPASLLASRVPRRNGSIVGLKKLYYLLDIATDSSRDEILPRLRCASGCHATIVYPAAIQTADRALRESRV